MTIRVAIAGLGAIGTLVASKISEFPNLALVAVSDRDTEGARQKLESLGLNVPIVPLDLLPEAADLVIEALPASAAKALFKASIALGKTLVPLSSSVIIQNPELIDEAALSGAKIIVPSGAVGGLDALKAAREGQLTSVRMVTRKAPKSLAGAPYVVEQGIDLEKLREPTLIFSGTATEAARGFPANVNVVAAVSMAGLGPEATRIEVWADPEAEQNSHSLIVQSDSSDFEIHMKNFPSPSNPRTSQLASMSVLATLRDLAAPMVIKA